MYLLAMLLPVLRRVRLPFSRDQALLALLAFMQVAIAVEVTTGHLISGTIVPNEWIPIVFGPVAGGALLLALFASKRRPALSGWLVLVTSLASIIVGLLGTYFHMHRAVIPFAPPGQRLTLPLLVWAPPVVAPLMFVLMGLLGFVAISGRKPLSTGFWSRLAANDTQLLFLLSGLAMLATTLSSVLDHARAGFTNPWLWVPTTVGILGTAVTTWLALVPRPSRGELAVYLLTLALLAVVGPVGVWLHIRADLAAGPLVWERLLTRAPLMAPLLYSNMALLGLIVLLDTDPTHVADHWVARRTGAAEATGKP